MYSDVFGGHTNELISEFDRQPEYFFDEIQEEIK